MFIPCGQTAKMTKEVLFILNDKEAMGAILGRIVGLDNVRYHFLTCEEESVREYLKNNRVDVVFLKAKPANLELAAMIARTSPYAKFVLFGGAENTCAAFEAALGKSLSTILEGLPTRRDVESACAKLEVIIPQNKQVVFTMFGPFNIAVDGKTLEFHSKKAKELLALMVAYPEAILEINHVAVLLWPNHELALAKRLYRDAVFRLRRILREEGVQNLVTFRRGTCALNPGHSECDYWAFVKGQGGSYFGEFAPGYQWAEPLKAKVEAFARAHSAMA